jgi:hypothetical protein
MNLTLTDLKVVALAATGIPAIAGMAWLNVRRRTSGTAGMQRPLGAGDDRVLSESGSGREAEGRAFRLHGDATERERFSDQWAYVQARFAESPEGAVAEADDLVSFLMEAGGYSISDFGQAAMDSAVRHPRVVEDYRSAYAVAARLGSGKDKNKSKDRVTTKELRSAMIHYRALFDELIEARGERKGVE